MVFPLRLRHELLGIMLCHIIIHVAGATFATKEAQCPSDATPENYTTILQREAIDYEQSSKFRNTSIACADNNQIANFLNEHEIEVFSKS